MAAKQRRLMIHSVSFFLIVIFFILPDFPTQVCRIREMKVIISRSLKVSEWSNKPLKNVLHKGVVLMLSLTLNELFGPLSYAIAVRDQKLIA